ncbi:hypothetical protein Hanom_Chr12g01101151 [Helianthus anomalus]
MCSRSRKNPLDPGLPSLHSWKCLRGQALNPLSHVDTSPIVLTFLPLRGGAMRKVKRKQKNNTKNCQLEGS